MNPAWVLLLSLLTLPRRSRYASAGASFNESNDATATINIATVISTREQAHSSSLPDQGGDSYDFVLVGSASTAEKWLGATDGYAATANRTVLYDAASWVLLEDGAQHEKSSTFWARFHGVESTISSSESMCTMVVEWEGSSWVDNEAVLAAIEIENRLKATCDENDTVVLAFTSAISDTVDAYLEGEVKVNDAVAPIPLQDVDNTDVIEASSRNDRIFVRLAGDICLRDASTATTPHSSFGDTEVLVVSLLTGNACTDFPGSTPIPPHVVSETGATSDWEHDLSFAIPVIFLAGCAGLVYARRHQKHATQHTSIERNEPKPHVSLPPMDDKGSAA